MINKILITILLLVLIQTVVISEEFTKDGIFFFSYPADKVEVFDLTTGNYHPSKEKYSLFVRVDDVTKWKIDRVTVLYQDGMLKDREALWQGDRSKWEHASLIKPQIVKLDNTFGKRFLVLFRPMQDSLYFQLVVYWYVKNYRIALTFDALVFKKKLIQENIECFTSHVFEDKFGKNTVYFWDYENKNYKELFYNALFDKSKPATYAWNQLFEEIISSIKIEESGFFSPTINNLRFRSSPDLKGDFIRMLKKGERLELLEKGKEEVIQGDKGTWVKVITTQGEIGWCFDAYLEEVKPNGQL